MGLSPRTVQKFLMLVPLECSSSLGSGAKVLQSASGADSFLGAILRIAPFFNIMMMCQITSGLALIPVFDRIILEGVRVIDPFLAHIVLLEAKIGHVTADTCLGQGDEVLCDTVSTITHHSLGF